MIKQILYRITAIALIFLVLISTVSFAVEKHFCCGELVAMSVYPKDYNCEANDVLVATNMAQDSCCTGILEAVKGQDKITTSTVKYAKVVTQYFVVSNIYVVSGSLYLKQYKNTITKKYVPPLLVQDAQIQHQVYII
ncbi:HYC_CC_PP family protein [Cellulophaga fucicola]|uniref:HYC_CC_PP family protein n=1 Tax=Cellulophaga fucicola TaxID=76595 RepID=UPI003EB70BB6